MGWWQAKKTKSRFFAQNPREEEAVSAQKPRGEEAVLASLGMTFTGRTAKYRLAMEEFFEEEAGEAAGIVAQDAVFLEEIVEDDSEAELL